MKNRKLKYVIYILITFILIVCVFRIKYVNENESQIDIIYSVDDHVVIDGVGMTVDNWYLLSQEEFFEKYGVEDRFPHEKFVVVELSLTNETEADLKIESMLQLFAGVGFETKTWCSSVSGYLMGHLNGYYFNLVRSGESIKYIASVGISRVAFDADGWKKLKNEDFYYVINLGRQPRKVNLGSYAGKANDEVN